jgi:hypothetical protein
MVSGLRFLLFPVSEVAAAEAAELFGATGAAEGRAETAAATAVSFSAIRFASRRAIASGLRFLLFPVTEVVAAEAAEAAKAAEPADTTEQGAKTAAATAVSPSAFVFASRRAMASGLGFPLFFVVVSDAAAPLVLRRCSANRFLPPASRVSWRFFWMAARAATASTLACSATDVPRFAALRAIAAADRGMAAATLKDERKSN